MKQVFTLAILMLLPLHWASAQQGRIEVRIDTGATAVKVAIPSFPSTSGGDKATQLTKLFNDVLWDDLNYTGNLVLLSPSFYPVGNFANPGDIHIEDWRTPQVDADVIVFGSTALTTGPRPFTTDARLWDLKLPQNQEMLGNRYSSEEDEAAVRLLAHR